MSDDGFDVVWHGTPTADVVSIARTALDAIFMEAGARLESARKMSMPTLFIGHANVGGSKMSTGQPLIGKEIELDEQPGERKIDLDD